MQDVLPLPYPRVLIIAGSDSGGGAGIQADIKTVTMLGGYAMTAITAITAQNTEGVHGIHPVPPMMIAQQISVVMEDIGADVIKIGMLGDIGIINQVATSLNPYKGNIPVILDPVMQAKGGASLLAKHAEEVLKENLFPLCTVITPNIPEAERLSGIVIHNEQDMLSAAHALHDLSGAAIVLKGGHLTGHRLCNVLVAPPAEPVFSYSERIETPHTHGTGCTLASALAVSMAQGLPAGEALHRAETYVHHAIQHAPAFGNGHGPLKHNYSLVG